MKKRKLKVEENNGSPKKKKEDQVFSLQNIKLFLDFFFLLNKFYSFLRVK